MPALVTTLAREMGDDTLEARLREHAESHFEPRHFGEHNGEFGYWFGLEEEWPRGQLSALMICADVGEGGAWSRVFRAPDLEKFDLPTVAGVDYPRLGISVAFNDTDSGTLHVDTYAADAATTGSATAFRVEQIPDAAAISVRRDGESYERWRVLEDSSVEIESRIGEHRFEISTGVGGAGRAAADSSTREPTRRAAPSGQTAPSAATALAARQLVRTGGGLCPCCS